MVARVTAKARPARESPMQIICPHCATSYEVQPAALSGGDRSVRCGRCRTVWVVPGSTQAAESAGIPADQEATYRADPIVAAPDRIPDYESMQPDGSTGQAPTKKEDRIERLSEWIEARAEHALADAANRHDDQLAPEEAEPPADQAEAVAETTETDDAPLLAPDLADDLTSEHAPAAAAPAPTRKRYADIEALAARRARREATPTRNWLKPSLTNGIVMMLVTVTVLIGWRNDVVRLMPQTASFFSSIGLGVNLRGIIFSDLRTSREQHDGVDVLVVEGKIVSEVPKPVEVPRLRFAVRNKAGHEIYAWTALPTRSILAAGESLPFRGRLASPPPDTRTVLVRFFNRRDIVAGTH